MFEDSQISVLSIYQLIYTGLFGYKYRSCGFYAIFFAKIHQFDSTNAMELIHHHIARLLVSPSEVSSEIPEVISSIILKLLTKNAASTLGMHVNTLRGRMKKLGIKRPAFR